MKWILITAAALTLSACSNKKDTETTCGNTLTTGALTNCTEGIKGERKTNGRLEGYWLAPEGMSALNKIQAGKSACSQMIKTEDGKKVLQVFDANMILSTGEMLACSLPLGPRSTFECVAMEQPLQIDMTNTDHKVSGGPCELAAKVQNDVLTIQGECGGIALFPITDDGYRTYVDHGQECLRKANGF